MSHVNLVCGCPVSDCPNTKNSYEWTHNGCGGTFTLSDLGMLTCKKCNHSGTLVSWNFSCGAHGSDKSSQDGILNAILVMGVNNKMSTTFLLNLTDSVRKQYS